MKLERGLGSRNMAVLERGLGSRNMAVLCYALIVVLSSGFFRCHFGGNDRERERKGRRASIRWGELARFLDLSYVRVECKGSRDCELD